MLLSQNWQAPPAAGQEQGAHWDQSMGGGEGLGGMSPVPQGMPQQGMHQGDQGGWQHQMAPADYRPGTAAAIAAVAQMESTPYQHGAVPQGFMADARPDTAAALQAVAAHQAGGHMNVGDFRPDTAAAIAAVGNMS